ncbi:thrombospondin type 3 repeat-containing protein [Thalassotalea aquiviva]|uniref:thrombospondin type 3 repeat-containing protein n=1 Tax=Thalassotalea aquiviva TaxID=3242415 RepID=UPI00352B16C9
MNISFLIRLVLITSLLTGVTACGGGSVSSPAPDVNNGNISDDSVGDNSADGSSDDSVGDNSTDGSSDDSVGDNSANGSSDESVGDNSEDNNGDASNDVAERVDLEIGINYSHDIKFDFPVFVQTSQIDADENLHVIFVVDKNGNINHNPAGLELRYAVFSPLGGLESEILLKSVDTQKLYQDSEFSVYGMVIDKDANMHLVYSFDTNDIFSDYDNSIGYISVKHNQVKDTSVSPLFSPNMPIYDCTKPCLEVTYAHYSHTSMFPQIAIVDNEVNIFWGLTRKISYFSDETAHLDMFDDIYRAKLTGESWNIDLFSSILFVDGSTWPISYPQQRHESLYTVILPKIMESNTTYTLPYILLNETSRYDDGKFGSHYGMSHIDFNIVASSVEHNQVFASEDIHFANLGAGPYLTGLSSSMVDEKSLNIWTFFIDDNEDDNQVDIYLADASNIRIFNISEPNMPNYHTGIALVDELSPNNAVWFTPGIEAYYRVENNSPSYALIDLKENTVGQLQAIDSVKGFMGTNDLNYGVGEEEHVNQAHFRNSIVSFVTTNYFEQNYLTANFIAVDTVKYGGDGIPDSDNDGVYDDQDAFPFDATESKDSDGDGYGDNSDVFPFDSNESIDSDNDGVGDNSDVFPLDPNESLDSDNDGVGDNFDVFPFDSSESLDSDNDGVGDNSDAFPLDPSETQDSDLDGTGDKADVFPLDPTESLDSDNDGIGDNLDNCKMLPNPSQEDFDSDNIGDVCDEDKDNDGILNKDEITFKSITQTHNGQYIKNWQETYNVDGFILSTNANGKVINYTYDDHNNMLSEVNITSGVSFYWQYNGANKVVHYEVFQDGIKKREIISTYDEQDRLILERINFSSGHTSYIVYEWGLNPLTSRMNYQKTTYKGDQYPYGDYRIREDYTLNDDGQVLELKSYDFKYGFDWHEKYQYDEFGNKTYIYRADPSGSSVFYSNLTYTYDDKGNKTSQSISDNRGKTTSTEYTYYDNSVLRQSVKTNNQSTTTNVEKFNEKGDLIRSEIFENFVLKSWGELNIIYSESGN